MSWTRWLLLGDLGQHLQLQEHEARFGKLAAAQSARTRSQSLRIDVLEREVLDLETAVAALVGLMRSKGVATDTEIASAIANATQAAERNHAAAERDRQAALNEAAKARAATKLATMRRRPRRH